MAAIRTVRDLISRSLRVATILGGGETADATEYQDALLSVNQMMDAWQADRLFCYAIQNVTTPLTAGVGSYTIGPAATINVPNRPVKIEYGFTRDSTDFDRPLQIVDFDLYSQIAIKDLGNNFPTVLYYEPAYPVGTINLWQLPQGSLTLNLGAWQQITEFANLDLVPALPPGYEDAIVFSLAERLCPEYGKEIPPSLARMAQKARANIQQNNLTEMQVGCEFVGVNYRAGLVPSWVFKAGLY